MNHRRHAVAAFLLAALVPALAAEPSPSAKSEIEQLLSALGDSPCELWAGSEWLEGEQAKAQLQQRYEALAGQIATAEDFIARASTSGAGGTASRVRCPGEQAQPAAAWLRTQLKQVRKQPITDPDVYLEKK